MGLSDMLSEDDVTAPKLCGLFKRAYMKATVEDALVTVDTDGPRVLIEILEGHKLVKFVALYSLREDADPDSKCAFINRLNGQVIFARFSVPDDHPIKGLYLVVLLCFNCQTV